MHVITYEKLGTLSWDLPSRMTYSPNTTQKFRLEVSNPTDKERSYSLEYSITRDKAVLAAGTVPVDNLTWFKVPARGRIFLDGSFTFPETNLVFTLNLREFETKTIVDSVSVELVAAPVGFEAIMPLLTLALMFGMVGTIIPVIRKKE